MLLIVLNELSDQATKLFLLIEVSRNRRQNRMGTYPRQSRSFIAVTNASPHSKGPTQQEHTNHLSS